MGAQPLAANLTVLSWMESNPGVNTVFDVEAVLSSLDAGRVRQALVDLELRGKLYVCEACGAVITGHTFHKQFCPTMVH